ncbi:MAG TPA: helix-turn-helix transcriptional regulator [Streptosporangiaceae bacterium]
MGENPQRLSTANPPAASFGAVLKRLRLEAGLTQEALAGAAGVSARSVSDLERGINRTARRDTARLLADGLNLTGDDRARFEAVARGTAASGAVKVEAPVPGEDVSAGTRTLPRDIASFTGRESEVMQLMAEMSAAVDDGGVVGICAIGGMAGIGKTTLAVHAAHLLARRFPDGQIFLPLHGHTPGHKPVDPADALASLLQTVGVAAHRIPAGVEERAWLWRDRVAGRRLLLLLDDAAGHEQVRPLLPGTAGSLILITSRRHLTALEDTQVISLDTLSPDEAGSLLVRLAGRPDLVHQDDAVQKIARLCGHLPLALGMLARQLHHHPAWSASGLADDLAAARCRLHLMHAENLSVTAAFDLSYQELAPSQQLLFRRLGLHPGTDIDRYAAAALNNTDPVAARRDLEDLYDHYLITEPTPGRYRFHDLIGEHARTLALADPQSERENAVDRLLAYYLLTVRGGGRHLARRTPDEPSTIDPATSADTPDLSKWQDATTWMDAERVNLHAAVVHAAANGRPGYAIAIPAAMHGYLRHQGHWDQVLSMHHIALEVARRTRDQQAEAHALTDVGDIQYLDGDYAAATGSLMRALKLHRARKDGQGEAHVLTILGYVQHLTGGTRRAAATLRRAVRLYRAHSDFLGVAGALAYLGNVQRDAGDYKRAQASLAQSLEIHSGMGNTVRQAGALNFLGVVCTMAGNHAEAASHQIRALELYRGLGNRFGEANALRDLGFVQQALGDHATAASTLDRALQLQRGLGSRMGEVRTLYYLGMVRHRMGDHTAAATNLARALELYRDLGNKLGEAEALNAQGELVLTIGEPAE